jgi:hypothetical protein
MDTAIEYLDERGWLVAKFPLIHLQAIGPSSCHPNAIAIQLFFNRRLFLCSPRSEFLMRVSSRVRTLGVSLEIESSALTVHDLEQFHAHAIKGESYGIFEVCTLDNSSQTSIRKKLILQRQAIIEVESSMDIVTYWPLNKLQTVVRPFWDDKMIVLGFAEEKNTVFHILHRDKFISTLFLLCHEGNFPNVTLQLETIERNRLYQPHFSVRKTSYANSAIEAMCLRKIVLAGNFLLVQSEYQGFPFIPSRNFESQQKNLSLGNAQTHMSESKPRSSDFSFEKHQLKVNTTAIKTRSIFDMDEAVTSSGFLIVLQEFNVNIPAQGLGEIIDRDLVAKSIQIVLAYLCFEVEANQYLQDHCFPFLHISMALQALMRLLSSPLGALDEKMVSN